MSEQHGLAFLLANWYSGATLFNILLNNHTQVVSNGEGFPFSVADDNEYTCSCGSVLHECEFYRTVGEHMLSGNRGWDRSVFTQIPSYSRIALLNMWLKSYQHLSGFRDIVLSNVPGYRRMHNKFIVAHQEFFDRARRHQNATLYLDGTKSFRRAEIFAPYTKGVLYIVRDGRGCCNSYRKRQELPMDRLIPVARRWVDHISRLQLYADRHPDLPLAVVRYEDLCHNLEATMRNACGFLGLPYEDRVLGGQLDPYHLLGNRMRMTFDGNVREDLSWQTELDADVIGEITEVMHFALEEYGYL